MKVICLVSWDRFRCFLIAFLLTSIVYTEGNATENEYTHDWVVEINGDNAAADVVAEQLGYKNMGKVGNLDGFYHFRKVSSPSRHRRSLDNHTNILLSHSDVRSAEQQKVVVRQKRDYVYGDTSLEYDLPLNQKEDLLRAINLFSSGEEIKELNRNASDIFNDPYWKDQWYLHDTRTSDDLLKEDLHVIPVWRRNITGKGVIVTILDDGLEMNHPDLIGNIEPQACYDLNDDDSDPTPRYDRDNSNAHGTRCAGEVAMLVNNSLCGVGVAFNSKVGGIRMLDGVVTDLIEAKSLGFRNDLIDIFSASWGPSDDGTKMEGPGRLAAKALEQGILKGRNGKGIIYVWASGNGGHHEDDCACDGYASNVYTISISSASQSMHSPWYSEQCPSTMATTYSSGSKTDKKIVSADLNQTCTVNHSGTSASAPLAAGIFALVLEANPNLTWRDFKHLVAWTSEITPLKDSEGWRLNGAGFYVNTRFGFGLLNADGLVKHALQWKTVPEKHICEMVKSFIPAKRMKSSSEVTLTIHSDGCMGQPNEVNFLENLQIYLNMSYTMRGALEILIKSPSGMITTLLRQRMNDYSNQGIQDWPFMTVHNWGESPRGTWTLLIKDDSDKMYQGEIFNLKFVAHGTRVMPPHVSAAPLNRRSYNMKYNQVKNIENYSMNNQDISKKSNERIY